MKKVAIQGTLGSYHDIAAHKYFEGEEIQLICCASFEDVFAAVKQDSQPCRWFARFHATGYVLFCWGCLFHGFLFRSFPVPPIRIRAKTPR